MNIVNMKNLLMDRSNAIRKMKHIKKQNHYYASLHREALVVLFDDISFEDELVNDINVINSQTDISSNYQRLLNVAYSLLKSRQYYEIERPTKRPLTQKNWDLIREIMEIYKGDLRIEPIMPHIRVIRPIKSELEVNKLF